MKTLSLLQFGNGFAFFPDNPFREVRPRPLPFRRSMPQPDQGPPVPLTEAGGAVECQREFEECVSRFEALAAGWVRKVFFASIFLCVLGAQHIMDTRKVVQQASQLRQAELETRAATQAYRQLQYQAAIQPVQQPWPAPNAPGQARPPGTQGSHCRTSPPRPRQPTAQIGPARASRK